MGTMAISDAVLLKSGANVNSTVSTGDFVEPFILQAESEINVLTRYNWTDAYGTLDVDVKYILEEAVSNLAAMYAINYDMSGYSTREEAETMLDVLRDALMRAISSLKDIKQQTFTQNA